MKMRQDCGVLKRLLTSYLSSKVIQFLQGLWYFSYDAYD
jgi:hypothetical protein